MTEYRADKLKKIEKKILGMSNEMRLLIDAELLYVDEYEAREDVCRSMCDAEKALKKAAIHIKEALASAEMEDVQDDMQMRMDQLTEAQ